MNLRTIILSIFYVLTNAVLYAQNIEKMNKSELKEHIEFLTTTKDKLKNENIKLQESITKLSQNSTLLDKENKSNQIEISRLNDLLLSNEKEKKRINSEYENTIAKLNETNKKLKDSISVLYSLSNYVANATIAKLNGTIKKLEDSISYIHSSSNHVSTASTLNNNDFLNKYYFNHIPLPNNSFTLELRKLMYGDIIELKHEMYYEYNDLFYNGEYSQNRKTIISKMPEILDTSAFDFWKIKPNIPLTKGMNLDDIVVQKNVKYFNAQLPKLEILKNKLFTIKYESGIEESFLFNLGQLEEQDNNNQRKILQFELANEEVKEDGTNNTAKDIVWRIFAIENECYLALTMYQLRRLNFKLFNPNGLEVYYENNDLKITYTSFEDIYYNNYTATGEGFYLSRKKDKYMENSTFVNPEEIIFLFKLK